MGEESGPEVFLRHEQAIMTRADCRPGLSSIRCPTLVVVAADDALTPPFYSEELAARIPDAKLVVLPTGGHFVPNLLPAEYNRAVGDFLRSHRARG